MTTDQTPADMPVDVLAVMDEDIAMYRGYLSDAEANGRHDEAFALSECISDREKASAAISGILEAIDGLKFDLYQLTTPELRARFGGAREIAVIHPGTFSDLRTAIANCKPEGGR